MRLARVGICAVLVLGLAVLCTPKAATAAVHTVHPGESIQAAVDAAAPGDTVSVMPGVYIGTGPATAAVRITKSLKLIAKRRPVRILPGPGQTDGILVEPENGESPDVERVTIKGFTVEGFPNNGIYLRHVNKFKIKDNESINNLENGIWPTLSAKGLVKNNISYGSLDSALWIEASENVRVLKNDLSFSPTGLEITVSKKIVAKKNHIHNNTVGIGLYHPSAAGLPPLMPVEENGDWKIIGNYVHDNNQVFEVPGGLVGELPPGIGILVIGVDRVTVKKNQVENNNFFGIVVTDWCVALEGTPFDCDTNPQEVEPAPDDNTIVNNVATGNGTDPPVYGGFELLASDILFLAPDGTNNCFKNNTADLTIPPMLPEC